MRGAAARGWSTPCATAGACRSSSCSCRRRHSGFPGGAIFTVRARPRGRHARPGTGSLPTLGHGRETRCRRCRSTRARGGVGKPLAARTDAQAKLLATQFREQSPLFDAEREEVARLKKAIDDLKLPTTLVMEEKPSFERPSTHLRERGAFTAPGEMVFANTPSALPPLGDDLPPNRLGLARWLVSRDNPLTARVMVNRLWEALYGRGLVETSEDFGTMGSRAVAPRAARLAGRRIHGAGVERQADAAHAGAVGDVPAGLVRAAGPAGAEPYNRLLARGPRFRMEAEMVRDVALAASGQLSRRSGGPSVFPPQPPNIWDNPYDNSKWIESTGEDRYRRSLYTFLRRTSPYPMFMTFDATSREFCTVRRVRTNTPLQALATLNDKGFFEYARALGVRMRTEAGPTVDARLTLGFRLVTSRLPTAPELARLRAFHAQARARYTAAPAEAAEALGLRQGRKRDRRRDRPRGLDDGRQRPAEPRRDGDEGVR